MTLINLIHFFRTDGDKDKFFEKNSLDPESEVVEIYMEKPFSVNKEIKIFEIEKTKGKIEFVANNIKYYNLFDFYFFLDFIEDSKATESTNLTELKLSEILINYSINDS